MTYVVMSLYLMLITMFWFSISMLMDLILLILSIMTGAYLISIMFVESWSSYLIVLAIVGGLMIIYSFIVVMSPNLMEVIIVPKYLAYLVMISVISFILLAYFISMEVYSTDFYLNVLDQYVLVNYYSVYPYVSLYFFLIIFLFMMLFIVDFVVSSYSNTMTSL